MKPHLKVAGEAGAGGRGAPIPALMRVVGVGVLVGRLVFTATVGLVRPPSPLRGAWPLHLWCTDSAQNPGTGALFLWPDRSFRSTVTQACAR